MIGTGLLTWLESLNQARQYLLLIASSDGVQMEGYLYIYFGPLCSCFGPSPHSLSHNSGAKGEQ
jgi:hypothetical protein